jgi:hypothetical protein
MKKGARHVSPQNMPALGVGQTAKQVAANDPPAPRAKATEGAKSSEAQGQPQGSAHLELFSFLKERKRRRPTA